MSNLQLPISSVIVNILGTSVFGIRSIEVDNWSGIILIVPKDEYAKLEEYEDTKNLINKSGVYILTNVSTDSSLDLNPIVLEKTYIGESDAIYRRIKEHISNDKMNFDDIIIVLSKDQYLTKTHVLYLESRLIELVRKSNQVHLQNKGVSLNIKSTSIPNVSNTTKRTIETFLTYVQTVLPLFGYSYFSLPETNEMKISEVSQSTIDKSVRLNFEYPQKNPTFSAKGSYSNGRIIVKSGAVVSKKSNVMSSSSKRVREELIAKNLLSDFGDFYKLNDDYEFNSLSAAANVIIGGSINGWDYWKLDNGQTFGEWQISLAEGNLQE